MNETIKITVIIPVYNVEEYLETCLDSVICQTLTDIEIICVDDKSTDTSLDIINKYSQRDKRVKCIQNKQNHGLSFTRNVGIKAAKGEYIFFLDSDDEIVKDALEKLYKIAKTKNYQMVFFDFINLYESEQLENSLSYRDKDRTILEGESSGRELFIKCVEYGDMQPQAWLKLYNRNFIIKNGLFFHEGILHEDIPYAVKAMFQADNVFFTGHKLYKWYHREKSITTAKTSIAHIQGRIKGIVEIIEFMNEIQISKREQLAVEKYMKLIISSAKEKIKEIENMDSLFENETKYKLFSNLLVNQRREIKISETQRERIIKSKQILIYGAGRIAQRFMEEVRSWALEICGVIVSQGQGESYFYGYKVNEVDKVSDEMKSYMVVVAVSMIYHEEIDRTLRKLGFENIEYIKMGA